VFENFKPLEMKHITQNRKHYLSIFVFLFFTFNGLLAQTLSEKLGAIPTDFTIISGEDTLEVNKQVIIKRAKFNKEKKVSFDEYDSYGYGYGLGYGYQSFHLEFTSEEKIARETIYNGNRQPKWICTFHCYDKDGKQILEKFVPSDRLKQIYNSPSATSFIYSLNLVGIPIVVLDNTTTIHIELQYHTTKPRK